MNTNAMAEAARGATHRARKWNPTLAAALRPNALFRLMDGDVDGRVVRFIGIVRMPRGLTATSAAVFIPGSKKDRRSVAPAENKALGDCKSGVLLTGPDQEGKFWVQELQLRVATDTNGYLRPSKGRNRKEWFRLTV